MRPGAGHWLCDIGGFEGCKDLFDPTELDEGVDAMSPERLDESGFFGLRM